MNATPATPRLGRSLAAFALVASIGAAPLATPGGALAADPTPSAPPKPGLNLNMGLNQLDKMLDKADATPDQRTKIKAIMMDAFMSMAGIAPQVKATAAEFAKSLMSPHVNRADLETARVSAVADFDSFTKVMVKAIGDAAETLTPEQRAKLAAKHSDSAPAPNPKPKSP